MKNFHYSIPTEIYFGEGQIENLHNVIKKYGKKVLLVYGGGSIKKIGLYDKVTSILDREGIDFVELNGVEPNPRLTTVKKGVKLCRANNIDLILPVGGGSTIDCSKVVAAGTYYDGDPWDLVKKPSKIEKALPIVSVLTFAATGSEMNGNAVISNMDTLEKIGVGHGLLKPKASILDPTYTYSVSKEGTAAGIADIMSHVFEVYFNKEKGAYLQNRLAEAVLKTCIHYGKIAIDDLTNYEARANLMWASSIGLNGLLGYGKSGDWSVHSIEHQLSAYYDLTHGVGLAILTPNWMEYVLSEDTVDKFREYGINVWNIDENLDKHSIAKLSIEKTREFFKGIGLPSSLSEVSIGEEHINEMAEKACNDGFEGAYLPLEVEDVIKIYKASL